jgi:hypothetical protein
MYVAAIFGLVGVVVGGLLNGGVTWVVERLRGKSAARVEARLLFTLLLDGEISLRQTAAKGKPAVPRDLGPRIRDLDLRTLASEVDDNTWIDIATAVYLVEMGSDLSDDEIDPKEAAALLKQADRVHEGLAALQPLAFPSKKAEDLPPVQLDELPEPSGESPEPEDV